jgi:hypothetical protein
VLAVSNTDSWREWEDVLGDLDPDTDSHLYEAAIDRAMTLEIGLAARCHVALDQLLHLTLDVISNVSMKPDTRTSTLIDRIEAAIRATPLRGGSNTNEKAHKALAAARLANQHRNRVLHDQWMAVFDDAGPRLERIRTDLPGGILGDIPPVRETLHSISEISRELTSAYYRVLGIVLFAKLSSGLTDSEIEQQCTDALDLMCSDFQEPRSRGWG